MNDNRSFRDISLHDWKCAIAFVRSTNDELRLISHAYQYTIDNGALPSSRDRFAELCSYLYHQRMMHSSDTRDILTTLWDDRKRAGAVKPSGKSWSEEVRDREEQVEHDVLNMGTSRSVDEERGILRDIASYRHRFDFPPDVDWVIPNWLQAGELHILVGPGGEGKSRLAIQLAAAIAEDPAHPQSHHGVWLADDTHSHPILEVAKPHRRGRILYVMLEDGIDKFHRRMMAVNSYLMGSASTAPDRWDALYGDRMDIMPARGGGPLWAPTQQYASSSDWTPLGREVIKRAIGHYHPDHTPATLLVIDTLALAFGDNENDRARVSAFTSAVAYYCERHGIACLIVAHPSKAPNSDYSGSTSWQGNARGMWRLRRDGEDDHPTLGLLKSSEGRMGAALHIYSGWDKPGNVYGDRMTAKRTDLTGSKIPDARTAIPHHPLDRIFK